MKTDLVGNLPSGMQERINNSGSDMEKWLAERKERAKYIDDLTVLAPVPVDLNADPFIYESETGRFVKLSSEGLRDIIYSESTWEKNCKTF